MGEDKENAVTGWKTLNSMGLELGVVGGRGAAGTWTVVVQEWDRTSRPGAEFACC